MWAAERTASAVCGHRLMASHTAPTSFFETAVGGPLDAHCCVALACCCQRGRATVRPQQTFSSHLHAERVCVWHIRPSPAAPYGCLLLGVCVGLRAARPAALRRAGRHLQLPHSRMALVSRHVSIPRARAVLSRDMRRRTRVGEWAGREIREAVTAGRRSAQCQRGERDTGTSETAGIKPDGMAAPAAQASNQCGMELVEKRTEVVLFVLSSTGRSS